MIQDLINQELISAVKSGNIVDIKHIIEQGGAEITALDEDGYSVLHLAVYRGYKDIVDYLVIDCAFDYQNLRPNLGPLTLSGASISEITADNRAEVANVVFLRGIAQKYSEHDTVKRYVNKDQILELMVAAINYLERSKNEEAFITQNPDRPQIDRKAYFQQEVITWVSACAKTLVQNKIKVTDSEDTVVILKALSSLGKYTDLLHANRGLHYNLKIVDTADPKLVTIALPEILGELFVIRDYVQDHLNGNALPVYGTDVVAIPALVGYYSDISHLERILIYTKTIMDEHFDLNDRLDKEAVLRSVEAIGEALTMHISEASKKMFEGIDLKLLSGVRNHLDHINGDCNKHKASDKESRAVRLEELLEDRNDAAIVLLQKIVENDIPYIHAQTSSILSNYKNAILLPQLPDNYDDYAYNLMVHEEKMELQETERYEQSWDRVKSVPDSFERTPTTEESGLNGFWAFLSLHRFLEGEPVSILGRLKDNLDNEKKLKEILYSNGRQHLTNDQKEQLKVLVAVLKVDENMHYLTQTMDRITAVRNLFYSIPKGETAYRFGSSEASHKMDTCIKSIEFNIINFNEHAQELYDNAAFGEAYIASYGADDLASFDAFVAKARKYFAHIGNNAFHGESVDHGRIVTEIVPLAEGIHTKLTATYQTLHDQMTVFLVTTPNWNGDTAFQTLLSENLLCYTPDLQEIASLARPKYGEKGAIKKLTFVGSSDTRHNNFQETKDGFGKEVAIHLVDSMDWQINVNAALFGGALMKIMETKIPIKYLLTHYFPLLPVANSYLNDTSVGNFVSENENAVSIGLHFLGGAILTYNLIGNTGITYNPKCLTIPVFASTTYGINQYSHDYRATLLNHLNDYQILNHLNDYQNQSTEGEVLKFLTYVGIDIVMALLMSTPYSISIGFSSKLLYYPIAQGAATGALNYYSTLKHSEKNDDYSYLTANTLTTLSLGYFSYKLHNLPNSAEKIIATAQSVSMLSLIHFSSKVAHEAVNDGIGYITDLIFPTEGISQDNNINFELHAQEL